MGACVSLLNMESNKLRGGHNHIMCGIRDEVITLTPQSNCPCADANIQQTFLNRCGRILGVNVLTKQKKCWLKPCNFGVGGYVLPDRSRAN